VEKKDSYGDTYVDWSAPDEKAVHGCHLDPLPGTETFDVDGHQMVSRWNLFAPKDSDIREQDRIKYASDVYDVDGTIQHYRSFSGRLDHLEVILKRLEVLT
jgi:hypothetical protein